MIVKSITEPYYDLSSDYHHRGSRSRRDTICGVWVRSEVGSL
jgi:hypothetical protein